MHRIRNGLLAGVLLALVAGSPALAQDTGDDLLDFIREFVPAPFVDVNGDGIPDLADLEVGTPGIWDEQVGAKTPEEFLDRIDPGTRPFDLDDKASTLIGPCGGVAISWDAEGMSIDAAIDRGDDAPPIDASTGGQAFTAKNPFRVDSSGSVGYFGFTLDDPGLSMGDTGRAFHDHQWAILVMDIAADRGGDPNPRDKNRNAGLVELGDLLPFDFRAKVKARGAIIDLWGPTDLPDFDRGSIDALAAGRQYCFGEGWVEFTGDQFPLFTAPGALATALAAAGFAGILFNARPALSWRA